MSITVTSSTAVIEVIAPNEAVITTSGSASARIDIYQQTYANNLVGVEYISEPAWIQFDTNAVPSIVPGRIGWADSDKTLELGMNANVTQRIGQELFAYVKSSDAGTRSKGQVVYVTGSDGNNKLVALAQANTEPTSSKTFAVMAETISGGTKGFAATFGLVRNLNTDALVEGAPVWLSPTTPGGLTATRPTVPNHAVFIGFCVRKNQNNGVLFVNIQNGYELEELHDVKITNVADGDILTYDADLGYWRNAVTGGGGLEPNDIPALVSYQHTQSAASTTWTIQHDLNFMPGVTIIDSGGNLVEANVTYNSTNQLTATFSTSISGIAYLS